MPAYPPFKYRAVLPLSYNLCQDLSISPTLPTPQTINSILIFSIRPLTLVVTNLHQIFHHISNFNLRSPIPLHTFSSRKHVQPKLLWRPSPGWSPVWRTTPVRPTSIPPTATTILWPTTGRRLLPTANSSKRPVPLNILN